LREGRQTDHGSPARLVPERLFLYLLGLEAEKALRLRYCLSLLCLAPDVDDASARGVARQIARTASRLVRRTDVATTVTGSFVAVMLVGAEPCTLAGILGRAANGEPGRPRFACGPRMVSVSAGASCYPITASSAAELLRQATDCMRRARREGGARLLLPSALLASPDL
jgi:hypothetical protein